MTATSGLAPTTLTTETLIDLLMRQLAATQPTDPSTRWVKVADLLSDAGFASDDAACIGAVSEIVRREWLESHPKYRHSIRFTSKGADRVKELQRIKHVEGLPDAHHREAATWEYTVVSGADHILNERALQGWEAISIGASDQKGIVVLMRRRWTDAPPEPFVEGGPSVPDYFP